MSRTLPELLALLKQLDEVELVELLGVNSEDLVDRFVDLVENDPDGFAYKIKDYFPTDDEDME